MYGSMRQDAILTILKKQGYATLRELTEALHYSTATINRDLNRMEEKGLIKRSYGEAELFSQFYSVFDTVIAKDTENKKK